jgi:hypothetical protein
VRYFATAARSTTRRIGRGTRRAARFGQKRRRNDEEMIMEDEGGGKKKRLRRRGEERRGEERNGEETAYTNPTNQSNKTSSIITPF